MPCFVGHCVRSRVQRLVERCPAKRVFPEASFCLGLTARALIVEERRNELPAIRQALVSGDWPVRAEAPHVFSGAGFSTGAIFDTAD